MKTKSEAIANPESQIAELQARLALYAILEEPGVECSRGKYWDQDKQDYCDGWLFFDQTKFHIAGFLGAGPTLEAALRNVQQKRKA